MIILFTSIFSVYMSHSQLKEGVSSRDYEALAASCREVVSAQHGLSLSVVCLLETRSVPKTTSGKIARAWCRRGFLEGSLRIKYRLDSRDVPPETLGNEEGGEEQAGEAGSIRTAGGAASSGKGGYQRVQAEDGSSLAPAAAGNAEAAAVSATLKHQTEHEVRALSKEELVRQLESILMQVMYSRCSFPILLITALLVPFYQRILMNFRIVRELRNRWPHKAQLL